MRVAQFIGTPNDQMVLGEMWVQVTDPAGIVATVAVKFHNQALLDSKGIASTSVSTTLGIWIAFPLFSHFEHFRFRRSTSDDVSAPHRMTKGASGPAAV